MALASCPAFQGQQPDGKHLDRLNDAEVQAFVGCRWLGLEWRENQ